MQNLKPIKGDEQIIIIKIINSWYNEDNKNNHMPIVANRFL